MKILTFVLATLLVFFALVGIISNEYHYSVSCRQYLSLADDASTAKAKLTYFLKYKEGVNQIKQESAVIFFQTERKTKSAQLKILDTLIERLEQASIMDVKSLEYQQAMYQISGQEMNHTLDQIDTIFGGCYSIEHNGVLYGILLLAGIMFVILWFTLVMIDYCY